MGLAPSFDGINCKDRGLECEGKRLTDPHCGPMPRVAVGSGRPRALTALPLFPDLTSIGSITTSPGFSVGGRKWTEMCKHSADKLNNSKPFLTCSVFGSQRLFVTDERDDLMGRLDQRFWSTTRGRILTLLRRGTQTVSELAAALGLTANAIRSQLTGLERDGLIQPSGSRRGARKPTVTYDLSPEADQLFPRAYGPVLAYLVEALRSCLPASELDAVILVAGQNVARAMLPVAPHTLELSPTDRAVAALFELGGWCTQQTSNGRSIISCSDCPLRAAAKGHPEICRVIETVLTELVGVPVHQQCSTEPPRCRFEIGAGVAL